MRPSGTMAMPSRAMSSAAARSIGRPAKLMLPVLLAINPVRQRSRVDLPAPLAPTSARHSPCASERSMPNSACMSP